MARASGYNSKLFELGIRDKRAIAANFHSLDAEMKQVIRDVVQEAANDVNDLTVMLAPKDTGFMSEHVKTVMSPSGFVFDVGWDAADFIEAGHAFYAYFQEFGTIKMHAQPSLGPAWDTIRPEFIDKLSAALSEASARSVRGST